MSISIVVPQLGESVAEGTVSRWLKAVGERVRKEEPLVEIQTDKINVEIPSPAEGTLSNILVAEGTTVLVGTEIGQIGAMGEATAAPVAAAAAKAAAAVAVTAKPGAAPAPAKPAAAAAPVATFAPPSHAAAPNGNAQTIESGEGRNLSPAVRKIMREQNVSMTELGAIAGSGVAGRITRDDLLDYLKRRVAAPVGVAAAPMPVAVRTAAPVAAAPLPSFLQPAATGAAASGPRETTIPFSRVRKVIADNMVKAKHTAAHTHCFDECDMSAIVALRKEWAPKLEAQGIKLTFMPFFIKAAVFALKEYPWVNGSVSPQGDAMTVKH